MTRIREEEGCQKQLLGPKLVGSGLGGHPKNFVTPYLFLQPLMVVTSNLVHNFGLGSSVPEATFEAKLAGVGPREHPQIVRPPYF